MFRLLNEKSETVYSGKATDIQRAVRDIFYPKNRSAAKFVHKLKSVRRIEARPLESELGMSIQALRLRRGSKGMNGAAQAGGNGFLKISLASKYPRAYSVNRLAVDGGAYYGPFRKQAQLRDLIGAIYALFPLRNAQRPGKNPGAPDVAEEGGPEIPTALYEKLIRWAAFFFLARRASRSLRRHRPLVDKGPAWALACGLGRKALQHVRRSDERAARKC